MRKNSILIATAILLSSSLLFSSCFGSFNMTRKVYAWNKSVGDKWVNELVFLVLSIVPVYAVAVAIDVIVANSIEFWTGDNPISADVKTQQVETENGIFTITTDDNGHKIQKEDSDEIVEFRFNQSENSWSLVMNGQVTPILQFVDNNHAKVFLANGSTITVTTDKAGVMALRQVVETKTYFAAK